MIIENLTIGSDKKGHPLKCGDICKFNIKLQRRYNHEKIHPTSPSHDADHCTVRCGFDLRSDRLQRR